MKTTIHFDFCFEFFTLRYDEKVCHKHVEERRPEANGIKIMIHEIRHNDDN